MKPDKPPADQLSHLAILGMGRMGHALQRALQAHCHTLTTWNRTAHDSSSAAPTPLPLAALAQADIVILSVADAAIAPLAVALHQSQCLRPGQILLHCAGRFDSSILAPLLQDGCEIGSFHPLLPVTESPSSPHIWKQIQVGVEGSTAAQQAATTIITRCGGLPFSLQGVDRTLYHAAAAFATNFAITLADIGQQLMQLANLPIPGLPLLLPLLQANLDNLAHQGLPQALTGPISRADTSTITAHIEALPPHYRPLYTALTQATIPIAQAQTHPSTERHHQLSQLTDLVRSLQDKENELHITSKK